MWYIWRHRRPFLSCFPVIGKETLLCTLGQPMKSSILLMWYEFCSTAIFNTLIHVDYDSTRYCFFHIMPSAKGLKSQILLRMTLPSVRRLCTRNNGLPQFVVLVWVVLAIATLLQNSLPRKPTPPVQLTLQRTITTFYTVGFNWSLANHYW